MKNSFLKILIIFIFVFNSKVLSATFDTVQINGNKRISNNTIIELINFKENKNYTSSDLNQMINDLYKSEFFSLVNFTIDKKKLIIKLKENPLINFFYIDGVLNKDREEELYENLNLAANKLYSESLLKKDIDFIEKIYLNAGFYDVQINPEIVELNDSTVNVLIKVLRNEKYKIKNINFIGNKHFKSSVLEDIIYSSEDGWWKFLSNSTTLNNSMIEYDKNLLKNFYLNEGYYDVQILSSDIEFTKTNQAIITYSIDAGKKYYFSDFKISDNNANINSKQNEEIIKIIKNGLKGNYSVKILSDLKKSIINYFNDNKIEFVDISIIPKKIDNKSIFVEFVTKVTDRKYINLITVKGNEITEEEVVRRNLTFAEGDSYVMHKLEASKRNLESTGIFKSIKTKVIKDENEKIDLEINLEEQPTGTISAGVGIGSEEASVQAGIEERNLFGKGINLNSNISAGTAKISGLVSLNIPDFKNTDRDAKFDFFAISTDYENAGYESKKVGSVISTNFETYENISFFSGIGLDRDSIETSSSASELYKSRAGDYMTYKFLYGASFDSRDRKFATTRGKFLKFNQSLSVPGSDIPYIDNNISGSFFHSLSENYVLNLKSSFNSINAFNDKDVNLSDRKFSTIRNLRGFESRGIGPKDGKDHIGGNYSAFSSLSSTFPNPAPEKWRAKSSIFFDAGNVWGVDYDSTLDSDKVRTSVGVSLDWFSPLGPLNFTLANTLNSADGDIEESFAFNIGSSF